MHRLRAPGGCPWDAEQTHESLIPNLIEEAYETAEAIRRRGSRSTSSRSWGILLLQPIFHAELAEEAGRVQTSTTWRRRSRRSWFGGTRTFSGRVWSDGTQGVSEPVGGDQGRGEGGDSKKHYLDAVPKRPAGIDAGAEDPEEGREGRIRLERGGDRCFEKIREEVDEVGEVLGEGRGSARRSGTCSLQS